MSGRDPAARLAAALPQLDQRLAEAIARPVRGRLTRAVGPVLRALLPGARLGELVRLADGGAVLLAEVCGLDGDEAILSPIGDAARLSSRAEVQRLDRVLSVPTGRALLGRVLNGLGSPIDGRPLPATPRRPVEAPPPSPMARALIGRAMPTGVRAIDALLTCAHGQRIGVFGPAGAGKSSLLAMLVRRAEVDVVVVALIGERGREVREFIDRQLGEAGMRRAVVVAATSDRPAVERAKAAHAATAIAEAFADEGLSVLLLMDSITRFARALREIGLAAGEPPARRGFPPSVFAELPRLLERAGPGPRGAISAFYAVLVEGEASEDPVAEEARAILDGHVVLSAALARAEHFPAIDVLESRSRLMEAVAEPRHRAAAARLRALMARHAEIELLLRVGEYRRGSDPLADAAMDRIEPIRTLLRQAPDEAAPFEATLARMAELAA